jgi:hypothetical protein
MPLTPEQATAALTARVVPYEQAQNALAARIRTLADAQRVHAFALLLLDADGKALKWQHGDDQKRYAHEKTRRARLQREAAAWLMAAPKADRMAVLGAFFPHYPHVLDRWLETRRAQPYQAGSSRRAFRAPGLPDLYDDVVAHDFQHLYGLFGQFDADIVWLAEHAAYINRGYHAFYAGPLLAAAIDLDEPGVFETIMASARGEHAVGTMGRHVVRALLGASRPEGWAMVEKLLLAAQREEGLRQTILEAADEGRPEAFARVLRVVVEHDMQRFASVVRALDVWLGYGWTVESPQGIARSLRLAVAVLESGAAQRDAAASVLGEAVYLALWAAALSDVERAIALAEPLIDDPSLERRFAAVWLLAALGIPQTRPLLERALEDGDLRIALHALGALHRLNTAAYSQQHPAPSNLLPDSREEDLLAVVSRANHANLFERVEALIARIPAAPPASAPLIWPWATVPISRGAAADTLFLLIGGRPFTRLIPYFEMLSQPWQRETLRWLIAQHFDEPAARGLVFEMAGSRDGQIRRHVFELLAGHTFEPDEVDGMELLLRRKTETLRQSVVRLLANQTVEAALASAERLLGARDALQRLGGLELLLALVREAAPGSGHTYRQPAGPPAARQPAERAILEQRGRALAERYRAQHTALTETERAFLTDLLAEADTPLTHENAFGLMDPAAKTPPAAPRPRGARAYTAAGEACARALDRLVSEHRAVSVPIVDGYGRSELVLLGNVYSGFPTPNALLQDEARPTREAVLAALPLAEAWAGWEQTRGAALRDDDGMELVRAWAWAHEQVFVRDRVYRAGEAPPRQLDHAHVVKTVLEWLLVLAPPPADARALALDALEDALHAAVQAEQAEQNREQRWGWRIDHRHPMRVWYRAVLGVPAFGPPLSTALAARLWPLLRWLDEPEPGVGRVPVSPSLMADFYRLGLVTDADVFDLMLTAPQAMRYHADYHAFREWSRRRSPDTDTTPALRPLFERARDRVLDIELGRGALPTPATRPARRLRYLPGAATFVRILAALAGEPLSRQRFGTDERTTVFSHLLRITMPLETDTPAQVAARIAEAGIAQESLIAAALFAPQWARHIEAALGWPGFDDAVLWIHAHTKEDTWYLDKELRDAWAADVAARTPLSARDLLQGAVDVAWFARGYAALGAKRWGHVIKAVRYASSGIGHGRARLYADVMTGAVGESALLARARDKRNQDAVRAIGLLPLPPDGDAREAAIRARYAVVQDFAHGSRKFGAARREKERLAAEMALDNLARTAGYPDPQRLVWAMEAAEAADLRDGHTVHIDDLAITLAIDPEGAPALTIRRDGKPLKTLPAAVKRHPEVLALRERKTRIEAQIRRMRAALEAAMIRGDGFMRSELTALTAHPVLAPMLEQLVFIAEGEHAVLGYPVEGGRALLGHDGAQHAIGPDARLRIAHAHDLYRTGAWSAWQHECFVHERIQPFRQVFRELYLLTDTERADETRSHRYAGHQVAPSRAAALFEARGWVQAYDREPTRTYHDHGITAQVGYGDMWGTPGEVEGHTLETVYFWHEDAFAPMRLADVPPRVFSETMRDLDLVVSVAHAGRVDPEASASTVEMRAALVRETAALLKLNNVHTEDRHILIEGTLGRYTVHLGSGVVHRQPGGALWIMPVHGQARGRLFLPFADDDPKTAEVMAKMVMLARDAQIKDPTILGQIYGTR